MQPRAGDLVRPVTITMRPTIQDALDDWAAQRGLSRSAAIGLLVSAGIGIGQPDQTASA